MKKKILLSLTLICLGILVLGITVSAAIETHGDLTYEIENGKITITDCNESASGELVIPSEINGLPVTAIDSYTFYNCDNLTDISIPDSVTDIGYSAFYHCDNLTNITLSNVLTAIDSSTFADCYSLTDVTIPDSVTDIGYSAFADCYSLTDITIPDSVTFIGRGAFENCNSLKSLSIPMDIYGSDAASRFGYLFGYTTLDTEPILAYYAQPSYPKISEEYTSGKYVPTGTIFQNYTSTYAERHVAYAYNHYRRYHYYNIPYSLKKIIITNDTEIDESAFYNCSYIEEIVLNNKITKIGNSAFYNCRGLSTTYYYGTPDEWSAIDIGTSNEYLTKNIIFIKHIRANNADDTIIIEPVNIESGKTVITALYNEDILSEIIPVTYTGEIINITPTKPYTNAKVMVWEDLTSMKPVCEAVEL